MDNVRSGRAERPRPFPRLDAGVICRRGVGKNTYTYMTILHAEATERLSTVAWRMWIALDFGKDRLY